MQRTMATTVICLALAGCMLEPPRYEGTEFACAAATATCPSGYVCVERVCRPEPGQEEPVPPDSGFANSPDTGTVAPDAGAPDALSPDARAPHADAALPPLITVTLTGPGTYDTHLRADSPDENYGTHRTVRADSAPPRVGLLRFDLSSIPPAAVVESAQLVVSVTEQLETGELIGHRMLQDWAEGEATWNHRRTGTPWTTAGAGTGSYDEAPLFTLAARDIGTYTIELPRAVVQAWVTQPVENHGVRWMSSSPDGRGADFKSSDTSQVDLRPQIRVTYR